MDWKSVKLPKGGKLFKVHNFNFLYQGTNYNLEIDEYCDGSFSGYGEHSTDKNDVIASVSGGSVHECLNELIKKIQDRSS